jgi:hypothetical protein
VTGRPSGAASVKVTKDAQEFLRAAAERAGKTEPEVLASILGVQPLDAHPEYARYAEELPSGAQDVLLGLDWLVRIANPGCQLVFRKQFIGYRRFDRQATAGQAARSQIFISLLPRRGLIRIVIPVDFEEFREVAGVTDLRGRGHHGAGTSLSTSPTSMTWLA